MGRSSLSPFGALLAEIRAEPKRIGPARGVGPASPSSIVWPRPEPDVRLETRVVSGAQRSTPSRGRALWPASLLLHAVLIVLLVVVPRLRSEALPVPVRETRAFFVAPAALAAPLPPPPPAAAPAPASRSTARPSAREAPRPAPSFGAPADVPEPAVDAAEPGVAVRDEGDRASGGEVGGVPGGIVGGVVGGVPAPSVPGAPLRVGGEIREPTKIRHVSPVYPDLALAAHVHGTVTLECLVSPRGLVTDVKLVRGIPLLNTSAMDAVKQWTYTPTLKNGVPVAVILTVTVRFEL